MSFKIWMAKRFTRRITKYEKYVDKVNVWLKRDKKELSKQLKSMTQDEYMQYGQEMKFLDQADFMEIQRIRKVKQDGVHGKRG